MKFNELIKINSFSLDFLCLIQLKICTKPLTGVEKVLHQDKILWKNYKVNQKKGNFHS